MDFLFTIGTKQAISNRGRGEALNIALRAAAIRASPDSDGVLAHDLARE